MRHIPEAGAGCGNSARTDLCGGRGETSVPTATPQRLVLEGIGVPSLPRKARIHAGLRDFAGPTK